MVVKINSASLCGNGLLELIADKGVHAAILSVKDKTGRTEIFDFPCGGEKTPKLPFSVKNPLLWSVSEPNLYAYEVKVSYTDGTEERKCGKFGFRTLSTNGKTVCVNGKPLFVRGYIRGTTAHEHSNLTNLSDYEFYKKNITQAKKFGFNFVRFHSVVPSEAFFEAADELGLLVHIELRPPHDIYNNLDEMVTSGSAAVSEDFLEGVVNRLYNHPSLAVYCMGNEIKNAGTGVVRETRALLDRLDGTRLFIDTCAWGKNNRPFVDLDVQHLSYYFPFGARSEMYDDTDHLLVVGTDESTPLTVEGERCTAVRKLSFNVPLLAHEVCHYTALRDFYALKEKFIASGKDRPWWIDEEIKMIESKGCKDAFPRMVQASKHFQKGCWKTAFEAMRKSKLLGGFHFLQFADTDVYENSNGVVDCFDDENYIMPEEFRRFNGDRVILADLGSRLFAEGECATVPLHFSNLGEDGVLFADLKFVLETESGQAVASVTMKNLDVSRKGVYPLAAIKLTFPTENKSQRLTLKVWLLTEGGEYAYNDWDIWVFARTQPRSYSEFIRYEQGDCVITADPEKALAKLSEGKRVCLVYRADFTRHRKLEKKNPKYAFKASWNRFKPVIWDRGTNFGGLCDGTLLEKHGFTGDRYYDFHLGTISEDCDKIILDDFPVKVDKIISGIDKSSRDRFDAYRDAYNLPELMYDRTLRDFGYLFALGVGKGKLLVCGLNLTALDLGEPSSVAMAEFILNYIKSKDFAPKSNISVDELRAYMAQCARKPVKERTMTEFWALDDAPVESPEFWRKTKDYLKEE